MNIVKALRLEEKKLVHEAERIQHQIENLRQAAKALGGSPATNGREKSAGDGRRKKRHFSAASRRKMAASQKARWARINAGKKAG